MKYIKTYEKSIYKYKRGNYVYATGYETLYDLFKIDVVNSSTFIKRTWDYLTLAPNKITGKIESVYIDEDDIVRELTPEEIKEYEVKTIANKYNL